MFELPFNHTVTIIIITVIISFLAFSNQNLMNRLIFWPPAMQKGQHDRFITHGFVHADGMHLLFNMFTLFFFGSIIETFYRQYLFDLGFVLFYLGGLIAAIIPSYLQHKNDHRWASLGASGAVSAVLFAYILFEPWKLIFVFFIPVPAIIFAVLYGDLLMLLYNQCKPYELIAGKTDEKLKKWEKILQDDFDKGSFFQNKKL